MIPRSFPPAREHQRRPRGPRWRRTFVNMQYQGDLPADANNFPVGNSTIAKYVTFEDPRGLVVTSSTQRPNPTAANPSQSTTNTYDNFGQLTESVTSTTGQPDQTTTCQYDGNGNRLATRSCSTTI